MGSDWRDFLLGDVTVFINRGRAPSYVDTGGIAVLNQKCIRDGRVTFDLARRTDLINRPIPVERMLILGDILVNSTGVGTLGRVAQITSLPEAATVDSHVTIVRPNPGVVDPWYLGFVLRAFQSEIEGLAEGSTGQTELSRSRLSNLSISLPPLPEQRAIAAVLGALDDKIELNRRMNRTLEAMARALFKSWFVDFDPVRAKMAGRPTGLPGEIEALFVGEMEEGRPLGWEVGRLDDVLVLQRGFNLPTKIRIAGYYPVIAASGPSGTHNEFMVKGPGVTTGRSGVLGNVYFVHEDYGSVRNCV